MGTLELKIPPLALALVVAALMWLVSRPGVAGWIGLAAGLAFLLGRSRILPTAR